MAIDRTVKFTVRLNMLNPAHVTINKVLNELNLDIFKSKNQFFIDAATYYIENYGQEELTQPKKEKEPEFVSTEDMEAIEERIRQAAKEEARQEANKEVMTSIKTQKAMLTQYAKEHGFMVVEIYVDDGWSGLNFDRPDFNRMLDDIESGKIDVVITKDLSRLGRDHLKVGHFTEIYFPMKNVRYIAVNDCVDTANKNNDIAALKNVMNEFYSRDNSRKIRSSIRARAKAGLYRSSFNPIGYRKAPDNHNKLIVDAETAWIVKRIFDLANAGMGANKIATQFREEQIPCPSWWLYSRGEKDYSRRFENPQNKYEWSHTVIRDIIGNPLYLGHLIMCRKESVFKVGVVKSVPETEWIRVDNTHEPLISQEELLC